MDRTYSKPALVHAGRLSGTGRCQAPFKTAPDEDKREGLAGELSEVASGEWTADHLHNVHSGWHNRCSWNHDLLHVV
jgi:hypothetical protein